MTTEISQKPEIFVADEELKSVFEKAFSMSGLKAGRHGWRTIKSWDNLYRHNIATLITAWTFENLTKQKAQQFFKKDAVKNRNTVFLFFQHSNPQPPFVAERMTWFNIRNDERIHFVDKEKDEELFAERLLVSLNTIDIGYHIIDSYWDWSNDILVVTSPTLKGFKRLRIPLENLPSLNGHSIESLENMEIDEDGIFIYWPKLDIHLGWEQFHNALDQKILLRAKQQSDEFNKKYGAAIRNFRQKINLRQKDIMGLTERQVGRIERGECRATHASLIKLAKAHQMTITDYMEKLSRLL